MHLLYKNVLLTTVITENANENITNEFKSKNSKLFLHKTLN